MNKQIPLPPTAFSNAMNDVNPDFDFRFWAISPEWKIFCHGYNDGLDDMIDWLKTKEKEVNK